MKIILSNTCTSITGAIAHTGYHLQHYKKGCFLKRNAKGSIPSDGHWQAILHCAQLARNGIYATDIQIHWMELHNALREARHWTAAAEVERHSSTSYRTVYHAEDIINLKNTFSL